MTGSRKRHLNSERRDTVLVIDDEPLVLSAARRTLERFDYCVLTAASGRQGIEEFHAHAGQIAAVLLDTRLPDITGLQTFTALRQIDDRVPILITSGEEEITATADFPLDEVAGFIPKPYQGRELADRIERALA